MEKQNKLYLRILIASQTIIFLFIILLLSLFFKDFSKHNKELIRKLVISDTKVDIKEIIDNTVLRIDLKRKSVSEQVSQLMDLSLDLFSEAKEEDVENLVSTYYDKYQSLQKGKIIQFILLNEVTGKVLFNSDESISSQSENIQKQQIDAQKSKNSLYKEKTNGNYQLVLYAKQNDMDQIVKDQVYIELHNTNNEGNRYVWVNEVLNYDGGDNYAVRIIHPNLTETEGDLLSTLTEDIEGNYPYLTELEGIKEKGEIFQTYYFKNKLDDKIEEKLSYSKLYEPFDWIISTGVPLGDMFSYTNVLRNYYSNAIGFTLVILVVFTLILFAFGTGIILKFQKSYKEHVDSYVRRETELDPLTGALNRKTADKSLKRHFELMQSNDNSTLLIMIDIDDFKRINDTYGHDIGDYVLQKVTQYITTCLRVGDMLYRWGGEEFLLILQGVKQDSQYYFANNIRNTVSDIVFDGNGEKFNVTLSMGGAYMEKDDIDYKQAVKRADNALYHAKNQGKNRYCSK